MNPKLDILNEARTLVEETEKVLFAAWGGRQTPYSKTAEDLTEEAQELYDANSEARNRLRRVTFLLTNLHGLLSLEE